MGPYGSQKGSLRTMGTTALAVQPADAYGDGQLDFLAGNHEPASSQCKQQQNALRGTVPSLYVQDTFHVTKRLTLVFGIRWDPFYMPYDVFNRGENFNLADFMCEQSQRVQHRPSPTAPAGMLFYGDPGVPRSFSQSSPNQWDPNFGFTFDPFGDGKTVLRAGAEYIYDTPNNFTMQRNQQNPPFATAISQSLNSFVPFSNPWSTPNECSPLGPGAATPANSSSIGLQPFLQRRVVRWAFPAQRRDLP